MNEIADTIMYIALLAAAVVCVWTWILAFWMNIVYLKYRKKYELNFLQMMKGYGYGLLASFLFYIAWGIVKLSGGM